MAANDEQGQPRDDETISLHGAIDIWATEGESFAVDGVDVQIRRVKGRRVQVRIVRRLTEVSFPPKDGGE